MNHLSKSLFIFVVAILLLILSIARAESGVGERPEWTRSKPPEDATYKYYLGVASESGSESQATSSARIKAREQAIRENFGGLTKIQTEIYQNNSDSQSVLQAEEISPQVILQDFEEVSVFTEANEKLFNAWVLYRFKKSAIQKEKNRISQLSKEELFHSPNMAGSEESAKINGSIEIKSSPPGIPVRIDGQSQIGEMELKTPLKLLGLFQPGEHLIELDDPRFKVWSKKIIINSGVVTQINEKMQRANGKLRLEVDIDGARIKINHKSIDQSYASNLFEFPAESAVLIEVSHPEMEPFSKSIIVRRDEISVEKINLIQKPCFITFISQTTDVTIELDGIELDHLVSSKEFSIPRGSHKVILKKDQYLPKEILFEIKGGQKKTINVGSLQKDSTPAIPPTQINDTAINSSSSLIFGMSMAGSSIQNVTVSPFFLSTGFVIGLSTRFSIDGELSFGGGIYNNKAGMKITDSMFRYRLGLPLSFYRGIENIISISPDIIVLNHSFSFENQSDSFATLSQIGTGLSLLLHFTENKTHLGVRLSVHQFSDAGNLKGQNTLLGGIEWYPGY